MSQPAPGEVGQAIHVEEDELTSLLREALALGGEPNRPFVWQDLDSELAVDVGRIRVAIREGLVLVGLPVRCDEVGGGTGEGTELVIPVAVGTPEEPAGLVGAVETPARGASALVVAVWGEAAVAATWLGFLEVCRGVAARAGEDARCQPMIPGSVWAVPGVLSVIPQARHAIDRSALP